MFLIVEKINDLKEIIAQNKRANRSIGFVPTMGALHEGHLSLVRKCKKENKICVVSIFVNPTQFNDPKDFEKYPVNHEKDIEKLTNTKLDILFLPTVKEIYPEGTVNREIIDLGGLEDVMEGKFRPGHFQGVALVMKKLLEITSPDQLYMGQKDYQQCAVIAFLLNKWKMKTKLVVCPTKREKNGLAMSSRNERLSTEVRAKAGVIKSALFDLKKNYDKFPIEQTIGKAKQKIEKAGFRIEYLELSDAVTLLPVEGNAAGNQRLVCCTAVWADDVRLIDNVLLY